MEKSWNCVFEFLWEPCIGFYTKLNVWGSLGLNFDYDGGPIFFI